MHFTILCPLSVRTGGPEALNQLRHKLEKFGQAAELWDPSFGFPQQNEIFEYARYEPRWAEHCPNSNSIFIVPEIYTYLLPALTATNSCVLWWLSVDNVSYSFRRDIESSQKNNLLHAAQSQYAFDFIRRKFNVEPLMLTDFISETFHESSTAIRSDATSLQIAYYPQKSEAAVEQLKPKLSDYEFAPIKNMSPTEVKNLLLASDVYIDFGHHPGRDRIPREAALLGNIVITNRNGSARNKTDIPIDIKYKFGNLDTESIETLRELLIDIAADKATHLENQSYYRVWISRNETTFESEVKHLIAVLQGLNADSTPKADPYIAITKALSILIESRQREIGISANISSEVQEKERLKLEKERLNQQIMILRAELEQLKTLSDFHENQHIAIRNSIIWKTVWPVAQFITKISRPLNRKT